MSNKKIVGIIFIFAVIVAIGATLFYDKTLFGAFPFFEPQYIKSVSRSEVAGDCNGKDKICVEKNGKIEVKQASDEEANSTKPKCQTPEECGSVHANNVARAVTAIRNYTKIPNLDLSMIENNAPVGVTYYCTKDNKCWAVNNETHAVVEAAP